VVICHCQVNWFSRGEPMSNEKKRCADSFRQSPRESFLAFLDMMQTFADHWSYPQSVMRTYFLEPPSPREYLFESLPQYSWSELSDDPEEIFAVIPQCEYYRVIEDSFYFESYRVTLSQLNELRSEWFVEFYVLPEEGSDWVLICTDGYRHFPSCIIRKK
jgi:hypothetical protein